MANLFVPLLFICAGTALCVERPTVARAQQDGRHHHQKHHHPDHQEPHKHSMAVHPSAKLSGIDGHHGQLPDGHQASKALMRIEHHKHPRAPQLLQRERAVQNPDDATDATAATEKKLEADLNALKNDAVGGQVTADAPLDTAADGQTAADANGATAAAGENTDIAQTYGTPKATAAAQNAFSGGDMPVQHGEGMQPTTLTSAEDEVKKLDELVEGAEAEAGLPDSTQTTPPEEEEEEEVDEAQTLMFIAVGLILVCCCWSAAWAVFYKRMQGDEPAKAPLEEAGAEAAAAPTEEEAAAA